MIPTERFLQLVGNLAAVYEEATLIPNVEELLRDYARDIGVKAKGLNSREVVAEQRQQKAEAQQAEQAVAAAPPAAEAAKLLSETDMGGGASALQQIMGA